MNSIRWITILPGLILFLISPSYAVDVNFDKAPNGELITAPVVYDEVNPCPSLGPVLNTYDTLGVTIDGGVILSGLYFNNQSNVMATSDFALLSDDSSLEGSIIIRFAKPVNYVSLRVINGFDASSFSMVTNFGLTKVVNLNPFMTNGDNGKLEIRGLLIRSLLIKSNQMTGNKNFAIDDLKFTPIPRYQNTRRGGSLLIR